MGNNITYDNYQKLNNYDISCFSEQGKRSSQQDSAYVAADDGNVIAIVCDGMGGYEGGQLASTTAVEAFLEYYQYFGTADNPDNQWMRETVTRIDDIIYDLKGENGTRLGAGTTLVGLKISGNRLSWVSVGDSRVYLKRGAEMVQVTTDHNYFMDINRRRDEGTLSEEQYLKESISGEALISFIGMGGLLMMDISEEPLKLLRGDTIIICTDGVYRAISNDRLKSIVEKTEISGILSAKIQKEIEDTNLIDQDNYTCVVIGIR